MGNGSGVTRIITGQIMADNGDGTFLVDLDDDGVGVSVVRAPTVAVGQIGTVLDTEGAQVLIGPRRGDDSPTDALSGIGSFENWQANASTDSGLEPVGWSPFWSQPVPMQCGPDSTWTADGALSARIGVPATINLQDSLILTNSIIAPAASMNLRVRGTYKPVAAQAGNIVAAYLYWGTTDANANPFGSGVLATTVFSTTLGSSVSEVAFDVTCPMPVGAYLYCRLFLKVTGKASAPVAGSILWDGVTAEWLDVGLAETPWVDWVPTLLGSTTNPNPGTAASGMQRRGRYTRDGTTVRGWGRIDAGTSGVSVGSGLYGMTLPVPGRSGSPCHATVILQNAAGFQRKGIAQKSLSGTSIAVIYVSNDAGTNGDTTVHSTRFPVNNSGDWFIEWTFQYEAQLPDPV